jgi:hypothetical protein
MTGMAVAHDRAGKYCGAVTRDFSHFAEMTKVTSSRDFRHLTRSEGLSTLMTMNIESAHVRR